MIKVCRGLLAALSLAAIFHGGAVAAQEAEDAELDALIDATQSDEGALALARRQTGQGDLTGAAVTLERSLLMRSGPGSDEVRLYYGAVLCRLGDQRRGVYQLEGVSNPAANGWAEARQACGVAAPIASRARGDGVAGVLSLGIGYDSDAFGALTTQFEIPGLPAITEDGVAIIASGTIEGRFATTASGNGYAGVALLSRTDISGPDIDYQTGAIRAGYAFNLGGVDRQLAVGLVGRHSVLRGDDYLSEFGAQAEYGVSRGDNSRWTVRAEAVDQHYQTAFSSLRDGGRYDLAFSYSRTTGLDRAWTVGVALEAKDAELQGLGYRGGRVYGAMRTPISAAGTYFAASGVIRIADYEDAPLVPGLLETRSYLRAGIGMPLNVEGLAIEAAVTHSARWYDDAIVSDYSSVGVEMRLVYRFGQ